MFKGKNTISQTGRGKCLAIFVIRPYYSEHYKNSKLGDRIQIKQKKVCLGASQHPHRPPPPLMTAEKVQLEQEGHEYICHIFQAMVVKNETDRTSGIQYFDMVVNQLKRHEKQLMTSDQSAFLVRKNKMKNEFLSVSNLLLMKIVFTENFDSE